MSRSHQRCIVVDSEIEILFSPNGPVLKVRQTKYNILSYITEALLQYWILIDFLSEECS